MLFLLRIFNFTKDLVSQRQDTYVRQISSRFVRETNSEDRVKKILQGNYAIIGKMIGDVYFPEEDIGSGDLTVIKFLTSNLLFGMVLFDYCTYNFFFSG